MHTREELEKREHEWLAPYAMKSSDTRGRQHKEPEHPYRTVYQRDKDRIVYSTAFRRLEYKTQVFVNHEGDYYRTRLTHTLEVAQIARTIARFLRLNEDLVEAIALAHDLGHTPFGHSGEDTLRELMKDHGGFDHNTHGLRVVDFLERRYPDFRGLNLSAEVRKGIMRHSTPFDKKANSADTHPSFLEIQVVDIADEIAYDNHDLDDGLKSGLLVERDLEGVPIWNEVTGDIKKNFPDIDNEIRRCQIVRRLIDLQVSDVVNEAFKRIKALNIQNITSVQEQKDNIVDFGQDLKAKRIPFKEVLLNRLYRHYRVIRMSKKAARFLNSLFQIYCENPEQLPPRYLKNIEKEGKYRVICDYLAGMTDRYALDQYKKFFEPYERV